MWRIAQAGKQSGKVFIRLYGQTQTIKSFFDIFPKTFPHGGPPKDSFKINLKQLQREYRQVQGQSHPDVVFGSSILSKNEGGKTKEDYSSTVNKAYITLRSPYNRIAHIIKLNHPEHLDITKETSNDLIAKYQANSPESALEYKEMLMLVLEAHESLETATLEEHLDDLKDENDARIVQSENVIDSLLKEPKIDWDTVTMEAIKLKYWVNIQNGIKEWEPGKPVHLTH
ncbi:uncharacterized protein PRCAT00003245001 [Priceomyces carsonii]|uniref:uncharacterized protein n=1 Tax=Priceomyces carsonii TaxID=28549 RepID=UPI002EDB89F9|nr:unnamed protein product [Priceomyces carsonii]